MFRPLTLSFAMNDPAERLDARAWRAIMLSGLARNGEGLVVCGAANEIIFSTARAAQLLERLGAFQDERRLPARLTAALEELGAADAHGERIPFPNGTGAIYVHITRIANAAPAEVVVWLREEVLRDDRLYDKMTAQFGITRREFQLIQLVRQGLSNREIARELRLAESTVKVYLHELFQECGVSSRTALVALVERLGKSS